MSNKRIELLGTEVDTFSFEETLQQVDRAIKEKNNLHHVCVNAAKVVKMRSDPDLRESVLEADVISPDGQSIVWASRILGKPLPERVNGTNLMEALVKRAHKKKYKIFFLGARQEIVERVVEIYSDKYSPDIVAGFRNGYFDKEESSEVAKQIAETNPDILFVAITSPKKEIFLYKNRDRLDIPFTMGVGGSFDVVAGKVKRAPDWMQKAGLEWFFRLAQEPGRMWKRYLYTNTRFIMLVLKAFFNTKQAK